MNTLEAARSRPVTDRPTRELARRLSGAVEVLLLWHPGIDRVELCVRDLATDVTFHLEVAPADAIDAFYHPYAYMARPTNTGRRAGVLSA